MERADLPASGEVDASPETPSPVAGFYADPNLFVHGGRFWLYATSDGSPEWGATEFRAFSSTDLVEWRDEGVIFSVLDSGWASGNAWAPGHAVRDGRHYLYYTADRGSIGVAVADDPHGPFTDLGRPLIAPGDFDGVAIDPSVFVDFDGRAYLYWGNTVAHCVPLAADMMSFDAAAVVSVIPPDYREAAWVHRRGDTYYLSWSAGDTREEDYRVLYATGGSPTGPWAFGGTVIEKAVSRGIRATGHHSIVAVPGLDDTWIAAYHRFALPDGDGYHREIRFDRLFHNDDGSLAPVVPSASPLRIVADPSHIPGLHPAP